MQEGLLNIISFSSHYEGLDTTNFLYAFTARVVGSGREGESIVSDIL